MRNASRRGFFARILVIASALVLPPVSGVFAAEPVTVFAAASLKDVLGTIAEDWKSETGGTVVLSFAASSALAKQIEEGAPADLFISADLKWMDYLAKADQLVADTRTDLLGNRIVLVAPAEATATVHIEKSFPLADLLGDGHLAMGNTDAVPAGVYGKAALEALGVWDSVKDKVAQAENVRAALLLVSRQEAPLGIVYETDAKADPKVKVLDRFPEDSHPAIIYPAAVLKQAKGPEAKEFLAYLQSAKAHAIFTDAGFTVLSKTN
ncbi:molybdate ABC transporter substrate-binding protein [Agrobacterium sp. a22-2]|uniref:molybdate ABC transporter substrate-binding protein n=1 Tax=Agrobacterium sp. a22-2 TaxID=2283840 RepID=UPI001447AEA1|nr:molybdate ABC transporter substrate-binding protein [Agrobacterium sp. a22-2]NKN39688.1 molybdate ABC transporter substrate-binding protein [Agrobacterium sp. a22-2]